MLKDRWLGGRKCRQFTLQWHLTNRCPYHCRHCYDRETRAELGLDQAQAVILDLKQFSRKHRVTPQVALTGGDPLLYPHFWEVYSRIVRENMPISILGNPIGLETIQRLGSIQWPIAYQVSLEGLEEHNDEVRGPGHFQQVMEFLKAARSTPLVTHVMVTLTADNIDQVLPLGRELRGLTHRLTFNRLAQAGEGKNMKIVGPAALNEFLQAYLVARKGNPMLSCKDNLFNVLRFQERKPLLRGCTGYGCGAAFNFLALLPDGEVHACRKVPSLLGHFPQKSLDLLYGSEEAKRWRQGPKECQHCPIQKHCRGCPAVTAGQKRDPLVNKDPQCFRKTDLAEQPGGGLGL